MNGQRTPTAERRVVTGPVGLRHGARRAGRAATLAAAWALVGRNARTILRLPSALVPTVAFPAFLLMSSTSGYLALTRLPGFPTDNYVNWYLPFVALQSGSLAGSGAGFAAARDVTGGFFDRLRLTPASHSAILWGAVGASVARALTTLAIVVPVGFAFGARPVVGGMSGWVEAVVLVIVSGCAVAVVGTLWALGVVYRAKSERAAPLFSIVVFMGLSLSTALVPVELMRRAWLRAVARRNPVTLLLRFARQGFVGGLRWADTWPALLAGAAALAALTAWAWSGLRNYDR